MKKLLVLILLFFIACENATEPEEVLYSVRYEVKGSASKVSITIENDTGGTSQFGPVSTLCTYQFDSKKPAGTFVYVSAQNQGETGSVVCNIYRDGGLYKSSTSSGAYVIATASGSL